MRNGFVPEAVLDELYRLTPMEETFGINNVALVDGQPRVLGLRELLQIYVDHRIEVVRRRTAFRRAKRADRMHLVDGLIIALLNIDEVIQVIRASDDAAAAKERLMSVFDLTEIQAQYILDTPLRRLTRFDRLELERERATLRLGDRRADRDPGLRGPAARAGLRRAGQHQRAVRHAAPDCAAGGQRRDPDRGGAAGGGRRPVHRAAVLGRAAGPHRGGPGDRPGGRPGRAARRRRRPGPPPAARAARSSGPPTTSSPAR